MEVYIIGFAVVFIPLAFILIYKKGYNNGKKIEQYNQIKNNTQDATISVKRQNERRDDDMSVVRERMQKFTRDN